MDENAAEISLKDIEEYYLRLKGDAEKSGYHLNPELEATKDLVRGLMVNEKRFGYPSCPCRLAAGHFQEDLDIICPCDYRDPDLDEYGMCFCALYVAGEVFAGIKKVAPIPERRPPLEERQQMNQGGRAEGGAGTNASGSAGGTGEPRTALSKPVWRCRVCGYLCARDEPPERCPICKAQREHFERFM